MTEVISARERLNAIVTEANELAGKGVLDKAAATRMAELITEGDGLKEQIALRGQLDGLNTLAAQSAGMMQLASPGAATVQTITPAGETTAFTHRESGALRIAEEYGEGIYDPRIGRVIGTKDYQKAFRAYMRTPVGGQMDGGALRTLQEGADASGGFLVPEDFMAKIIAKEPTPTRVYGRVTHLTTSRDALVMPKLNYSADDLYTSGMRVTWTGEVPASSTAMRVTDPVWGQARIPVYTAMMSIPVTNDMIEDSAFPLVDYISGKFSETVDLLRDNMILNGTGQGQPAGILLAPGTANNPGIVLSGSAGTIGTDGTSIIKTAMSLPEQYDDNSTWVMNKTNTGNAVAQLKDAQGRFLWGLGYQESGLSVDFKTRPLAGYPVIFSGFMPNIGAANFPMIFGDLTGYYMVNRIGFSVQILRELYAETNQILILGRIRFGGQVVEPWKMLTMKSNNS
jgi:HK97 family phage major capsid protein